MRANLVARGASDKGFWFTEMGWSTCASGCYTEAQQAEYVTRAISAMRNKYSDYVRGAFFYRYDDLKSNPDATDTEASFGFVHTDGSPKPALASLRQAVSAG
jgi:exo-beta-1,3-glucanase (GH17 family)